MTARDTFPPGLNRGVDFCCDRYGCGHHIDGHGYGENCYVPGCPCTCWRDHVNCDHRNVPEEKAIVRQTLRSAGYWLRLGIDRKVHEGAVGDAYATAAREIAAQLAEASRPEEMSR